MVASLLIRKTFEDADEARYDVIYEHDPSRILILDKNTDRAYPAEDPAPADRKIAASLVMADWLRTRQAPERMTRYFY